MTHQGVFPYLHSCLLIMQQTFAKKELPPNHRVVGPDSMNTMDHNKERCVTWKRYPFSALLNLHRMNIHLGEDGTIMDVKFG